MCIDWQNESDTEDLCIVQPETGIIDQEYADHVDYSAVDFVPLCDIERREQQDSGEEGDSLSSSPAAVFSSTGESSSGIDADEFGRITNELYAEEAKHQATRKEFPTFGTEYYHEDRGR
jgi:hypothetical protein